MPPKHHPHPKWKTRQSPPKINSRTSLSKDEVEELAQKMREKFNWTEQPRPFQLQAVQAQLEGTDVIIQAPTGAGKTAIAAGPHVWPSVSAAKMTTIMVSPLLSLEEEMACHLAHYHPAGTHSRVGDNLQDQLRT